MTQSPDDVAALILKECPLCAGDDIDSDRGRNDLETRFVCCLDCGVQVEGATSYERWNTRALPKLRASIAQRDGGMPEAVLTAMQTELRERARTRAAIALFSNPPLQLTETVEWKAADALSALLVRRG